VTAGGKVHADIAALKAFREALAGYRYAQGNVADRGDREVEKTLASLEAKASRWRARVDKYRADLDWCMRQAASGPPGHYVDCSGFARAMHEAEERLENVRRWQQRVEQEAAIFRGLAGRFRHLLDADLPHAEDHLAALIDSLEETRGLKIP